MLPPSLLPSLEGEAVSSLVVLLVVLLVALLLAVGVLLGIQIFLEERQIGFQVEYHPQNKQAPRSGWTCEACKLGSHSIVQSKLMGHK